MANQKVTYDPNTDYQALINEAEAAGDYASAAQYEQQRNQKIADLNASGTNIYNAVATNKYQNGTTTPARPETLPQDPNKTPAVERLSSAIDTHNAATPEAPAAPTQQMPENYQGSAVTVGTHTDDQASIRERMNANSIAWYAASPEEKERLHAENLWLASLLGDGVTYNEASGEWSGQANKPQAATGTTAPATTVPTAPDLTGALGDWRSAAEEQAKAQTDYATQQAVLELQRAVEDAQAMFKQQQESNAIDERQALDNSALYAEMRGDKGGIGQEQYNEIQNAAAANRLAVQQAQTKLATDTDRQIADLRAQGEFEKADKVLEIAQTYLSNLISLEQWAAEYNMSAAQFAEQIRQWNAEFELAMREFDANLGFKNQGTLAEQGQTLLSAGIMPSASQLEAMGWTESQATQYLNTLALQSAGKGSGVKGSTIPSDLFSMMRDAGIADYDSAYWYLVTTGKYNDTQAQNMASSYLNMLESRPSSGTGLAFDEYNPLSEQQWLTEKEFYDSGKANPLVYGSENNPNAVGINSFNSYRDYINFYNSAYIASGGDMSKILGK